MHRELSRTPDRRAGRGRGLGRHRISEAIAKARYIDIDKYRPSRELQWARSRRPLRSERSCIRRPPLHPGPERPVRTIEIPRRIEAGSCPTERRAGFDASAGDFLPELLNRCSRPMSAHGGPQASSNSGSWTAMSSGERVAIIHLARTSHVTVRFLTCSWCVPHAALCVGCGRAVHGRCSTWVAIFR